MQLVNIDYIPGKEIEVLGLVKGTVVYSKNFGKDFMAGMKTLVGGEIEGYTEMLVTARQIATKRMVDEAESLGADAVVNVRFGSSSVMQGAADIPCTVCHTIGNGCCFLFFIRYDFFNHDFAGYVSILLIMGRYPFHQKTLWKIFFIDKTYLSQGNLRCCFIDSQIKKDTDSHKQNIQKTYYYSKGSVFHVFLLLLVIITVVFTIILTVIFPVVTLLADVYFIQHAS